MMLDKYFYIDTEPTGKDRSDDGEKVPDDEELNREYVIRQFYSWGPIFKKWCVFFILFDGILGLILPGALFMAILGIIGWCIFFALRYYVDKQKKVNPDGGMQIWGRVIFCVLTSIQIIEAVNKDAPTPIDTGPVNALVYLCTLFILAIFLRVLWTPALYRYAIIAVVPSFFHINPRFSAVFGPSHYEAFAFLIAFFLGELMGEGIMEIQKTNYIANQKNNMAVLIATRNRAAVVEESFVLRERIVQLEQEKDRASKMADSMLNHTLKNILADGISSVELYEQTRHVENLENAKRSMKRGLMWTRRRQSLIMVCEGNYHPQKESVQVHNLISDCIDGREIDIDLTRCSPGQIIQIDPMLVGLALENGISNAIKHNAPGSSRPLVTAKVHMMDSGGSNDSSHSPSPCQRAKLEVTIRNNATPGAPFISKELEKKLFQEGIHGRGSTVNSDGIGLGHSLTMAKLLGGGVSLRQKDRSISYTLTAPTSIDNTTTTTAFEDGDRVSLRQKDRSISYTLTAPTSIDNTIITTAFEDGDNIFPDTTQSPVPASYPT